MLPQAPEFDRFCDRVPSDSSTPAALWVPACPTDLGPWAEGPRDGVICSEGAMKANWITASKAGKTKEVPITAYNSRSIVAAIQGDAGYLIGR